MTNREYILENLINRLRQMNERIETYKSSEANFDNNAAIYDIALQMKKAASAIGGIIYKLEGSEEHEAYL